MSTKNFDSKKKDKFNRLINEKNPYLLQHATNPVDWYPWGKEAFDKARNEDKPIFLSIGYSTCHWCHVMEKESFEDPEVAKLMNETFVSIKVDREERPEIDSLYMSICQMITGSGGWPLTIIMGADKRPFTAGTYFPKVSRYGRIGMIDLIHRIKNLWENEREKLEESAQEVFDVLKNSETSPGEEFSIEILDEAFNEANILFDEENGGFKGAPKFPSPHKLLFLLRYWYRTRNEKALEIVERTLQAMRNGGIYDHIGFGFHRYSTDSQWLLPHFEKMLYDQALLALTFLEAYQVTKKDLYKNVVEEIFTYVLRDMTAPEGAFYSAEDADSEDEEGLFYTWTNKEIEKILNPDELKLFLEIYNFEERGNFIDQASRERTKRNIPHLKQTFFEISQKLKIQEKKLISQLETIRTKIFAEREKRIHPHKDDKILTDWNGLMITALAIGGRILGNTKYTFAAKNATDFILNNMLSTNNRLYHRYRDSNIAIPGMIDDYAFLIWGLLELYQTTFNVDYLLKAKKLNNILLENFWDEKNGGFFFTAADSEELLIRKKEIYDGAIPSGNSISMLNFIKLSRITADIQLEEKIVQINRAFSSLVEQALLAHSMFLCGLEYIFGSAFEVVIVGNSNAQDTQEMLTALRKEYIPNKVVMLLPLEEKSAKIHEATDFVKYKESIDQKATAHVCINRFCKFPTTDIEKMLELLKIS
ncbi:MAG: thioredoxin domain-containing protein [Candidatus Heimdallarchaeota archaeon]|nr:thioredoxin domain-containing protein [Candidatus Heimdallarchaeota archaeon]